MVSTKHLCHFGLKCFSATVMDDFKLSLVIFLIKGGFTLGQDFSMDANGDLIIGTLETFSALSEFMDSLY